jgi:PKD repeat protein
MKTFIPVLFLSILCAGLFAQAPVYTASEFGVAGDSLYYSVVTGDSIQNLAYNQAGAGVNWNFSTLSPTVQVNDNYLNPLNSGYLRAFLTECAAAGNRPITCETDFVSLTNLAFRAMTRFQVSTFTFSNVVTEDYLNVNANTLTTNILGITTNVGGQAIPFTTTYIQPDVVHHFPIAYQSLDSSLSSYDINLTPFGVNFIYHAHEKRVNYDDAWGSLTTPYTTYPSTVREYSVVYHNDSAFYNGALVPVPSYITFEYSWFAPSYIGPVFTASGNLINRSQIFTNIAYLDAPVCLSPKAAERHEPYNPVIDVPGSITVNFNNLSIDANTYLWNFGDPASGGANTSASINPTHTYTDTGLYQLSLIACNTICIPERCDTFTYPLYVRDSGQVRAYFLAEPTLLCSGQQVNFVNLSAHATSYFWDFGDLGSSTAQSPQHKYASAGTYTVTLIAYGASGTDTATRTISVQSPPAPVINESGPTTFCSGNSVILYGSGGTIYQWSNGQLGSSITVGRSGSYYVTATNSCGTASAGPVVVTVNTPVDTLVAAGDTIQCYGDSVLLKANTGSGLVYKWRRDGEILEGVTTSSYEAKATGYYTVNVTENGCMGLSNPVTVIINPQINAAITAPGGTNICSGSNQQLKASPIAAGFTYQWQYNGTNIPGATSATYNATAAGTYTAVVSRNQCSAVSNSIITTLTTTPSPVISYQGNPTICSGSNIYFTTSAGNGYTFQWQQNGQAIGGATSQYYYASVAGTYTVVVSDNGCSATSPGVGLTVNPTPLANAGPNQSLVACSGGSVTIGSAATGGTSPYTYLWTPSSGLNGDTTTATTSVSNLGSTTTYTLLVTDAKGCQATSSTTVTVTGNALTASITAVGDSDWCVGSGGSISLAVIPSAGSNFTYNWSPATGLSSANTASTIASPTVAGTYVYTALVTNAGGCQASAAITVQVVAVPVATITALDTTAPCQGDSVLLAATPGAGYTYQWLNNSEPIQGSTDINYTTTEAGNYSVSVTSGICSATSGAVAVTVRPNPSASISTAGGNVICAGISLTLQAQSGNGYTYQWYENDYGIGGANSETYSATDSASYYYIVGLNGCYQQSDSVVLTVNPYPQDSVAVNGPAQYCAGQSTTLSASTGAGYTYQWQANGQTLAGANTSSYAVDSTGTYTVAVTALGCTSNSLGVDITVYAYPVATITSDSSLNFCQGDSVTLAADTGTGFTYQWQVNGDTIDGALGSSFVANDTGSYNVAITQNGCTSQSNALYVNVLPLPFAFATAPNNDYMCPGGSTVIHASTGLNYTYQWIVYPNSPLAGATADSFVVTSPGTYSVIISAAGCVTPSNYVPITLDPLPTITQNGDVLTASAGSNFQWYQDSLTIIPGATQQSYSPANADTFNVMLTDLTGCTQESASFVYWPAGINTVNAAPHISMYPNPAHDAVNVIVNSTNEGNITLKLYDLLGSRIRSIYEGKIYSGDNYYNVSLSGLPQGVYILSIYDGQNTVTEKLVKE